MLIASERRKSSALTSCVGPLTSGIGDSSPRSFTMREAGEERDPSVVRASAYQHAFENAKSHRSFFVTESGLMGFGPASLEIHDKLVILFGSNWPVLIYEKDEHYSVVGTCYVQGIMDGEVVRKFEEEGRPTETFILE